MISRARVGLTAVSALLALATVTPVSAGSSTTTRWVDDDGKAGPNGCAGTHHASESVQGAVNRSDQNDVVIVCPGTYPGVVGIQGNRKGLTVRGYTRGTAVIKAPKSLAGGPLTWVDHVSGVTLQWLTFAFPSAGCGPRVEDVQGLWGQDADGLQLRGNVIRTIGDATQSACGYDDGIRILSSANIRVSSNVVRDFKSDGISIENGSRGKVDGNAVHFYHGKSGSDEDGDQGIRIVDGARAEVSGNVIRSYPGDDKPHTELGISLQHASGVVDVHDNKVWYTKTGIGVIDSTSRVVSNDVFGVGGWIGIHVLSGTANQVLRNRVQNYLTGIEVVTAGNTLRQNDARGNVGQGCLDQTSGSGSAGTANTWTGNIGSPAGTPAAICPAS